MARRGKEYYSAKKISTNKITVLFEEKDEHCSRKRNLNKTSPRRKDKSIHENILQIWARNENEIEKERKKV